MFRIPMPNAQGSLAVTAAGSGSPFLFMPGLSATMEDNLDAAAGLIGDFRVIAFDPRGHGRSTPITDAGGYQISAMVRDLLAILDALRIERATVGGISMGAAVAHQFALDYPNRVDLLLAVGPAFGDTVNRYLADLSALADLIESKGMPGALLELLLAYREGGWSELRSLVSGPRIAFHDARSLAVALRTVGRWVPFGNLEESVRRLRVAVRVLAWPGDAVHPLALARSITESARDGRLAVISDFDLVWRSPWNFARSLRQLILGHDNAPVGCEPSEIGHDTKSVSTLAGQGE